MKFETDVNDKRKAKAIAKALKLDNKSKRCDVKITNEDSKVILDINAQDEVAFRAAKTANMKALYSCVKTLDVMR